MLGNRHWGNVLGELKELRIEMETEKIEKDKLIPLINYLRKFEFDIGQGVSLIAEENLHERSWMGPIKRRLLYPQEDKWEETRFHVVMVVWRVRSVGKGSAV